MTGASGQTETFPARDFKLRPLLDFAMSQPTLGTNVEALVPVVQAFAGNTGRLRSMMLMQMMAIHFSCQIERCYAAAEFEITGKFDHSMPEKPRAPNIDRRTAELFHQYSEQEISKGDGPDVEAAIKFKLADAFNRLNMISMSRAPQVIMGLEAILSSLVLGAWTAIETMAGDLWEVALNNHPQTLAELKGAHKRLQKGKVITPRGDDVDTADAKKVPLNLIHIHQYDLRNKMGTVLRERFAFDRLDGIKEAYGTAFPSGTKTTALDNALLSEALPALSAVRNVLVHRAGIVDREYERRSKHLVQIPTAAIGQPIQLNGENVAALVNNGLNCGGELLNAVGNWISHP